MPFKNIWWSLPRVTEKESGNSAHLVSSSFHQMESPLDKLSVSLSQSREDILLNWIYKSQVYLVILWATICHENSLFTELSGYGETKAPSRVCIFRWSWPTGWGKKQIKQGIRGLILPLPLSRLLMEFKGATNLRAPLMWDGNNLHYVEGDRERPETRLGLLTARGRDSTR